MSVLITLPVGHGYSRQPVEQAQQVDGTRTDEYAVATWLHTWYDLYTQPNVRQATAGRYKLMIETYTIPASGRSS